MATYGDMKTRIARELVRSDLDTDIADQINSAIAQYQRKKFFFNDKAYASWVTVANQEVYAVADGVPDDIVSIDWLTTIYTTTREPVKPVPWDQLEWWQTGTFKGGQVTHYAYYEQKFRLFPIPTTVQTLNLAYRQRVAAPTLDADIGPWVNDAEELIRSAAKRRIFQHVIIDEAQLQLMAAAEDEAFKTLTAETALRTGTGRVRPTQF